MGSEYKAGDAGRAGPAKQQTGPNAKAGPV
jgi:hypothetical protein